VVVAPDWPAQMGFANNGVLGLVSKAQRLDVTTGLPCHGPTGGKEVFGPCYLRLQVAGFSATCRVHNGRAVRERSDRD
jgi:hypothetical protein